MTIGKAFLYTLAYYLIQQVISLWILFVPDVLDNIGVLKSINFINSIIALIVLVLIFKSKTRAHVLQFNKTNPKFYLIAIISGVVFVFFQSFLNLLYYLELPTKFFNVNFDINELITLNALTSVLIVPFTEELFFRNFILKGLLRVYKPFTSILLSSAMFAIIHIPFIALFVTFGDFDLHQAYIVLFGSLFSGFVYYKSKSVIPSLLFHIFWNLTIVLT